MGGLVEKDRGASDTIGLQEYCVFCEKLHFPKSN